jgi:hypothetical protein
MSPNESTLLRRRPNLSGDGRRVRLPGFGLFAHYHEGSSAYLNFLSSGVTLREQRMLDFVNQVTDRAGWHTEVFDDGAVERWLAETAVDPDALDGDVYMSRQMVDFVGARPPVLEIYLCRSLSLD